MTVPTLRAVVIFAAGVPLALLLAVAAPHLWYLAFDYGFLVLIATAGDALIALPRRSLATTIRPPDRLYVGEPGSLVLDLDAANYPRSTVIDVKLEQRGSLD